MISHKKVSGFELTLGAGGLRFKKRPSDFNICIAKELKGKDGSQQAVRTRFKNAVQKCKGNK